MKRTIAFLSLLFMSCGLFAQKRTNSIKLQGGIEAPVGDYTNYYQTGFGFHLTDYIGISDKGDLYFTAGYVLIKGTTFDHRLENKIYLLKTGYRQFTFKGLYLQADLAGASFVDEFDRKVMFAYSCGIGYLLRLTKHSGVDLSVKFNRIPDRSWIGLNAGYQIALRK